MKLIIAGSRNLDVPKEFIDWAVKKFFLKPTEVVCGMATGIDTSGAKWAHFVSNISIKTFPAQWALFRALSWSD